MRIFTNQISTADFLRSYRGKENLYRFTHPVEMNGRVYFSTDRKNSQGTWNQYGKKLLVVPKEFYTFLGKTAITGEELKKMARQYNRTNSSP